MFRLLFVSLMITIGVSSFAQGKINRNSQNSKSTKISTTSASSVSGKINGHDYVDLGLPSGIKWATCNVGANSAQSSGDFFAWAETSPKNEYSWDTYFDYDHKDEYGTVFCKKYLTYVNQTATISPDSGDDAARKNWGGTWRMPTSEEFKELQDKCVFKSITINGVSCWKVIGPSKKFIILPLAGKKDGKQLVNKNEFGYYWTSSVEEYSGPSNAEGIVGYWRGISGGIGNRYQGATIRPVSN